MSRFFDSEMVRESIEEINEIQEKIFNQLLTIPYADKESKKEHLNLMKEFLEKQKLFIFRLSLSDDPEAIELKENILESARLFGLKPGQGVNEFFEIMEGQINYLEESLDT